MAIERSLHERRMLSVDKLMRMTQMKMEKKRKRRKRKRRQTEGRFYGVKRKEGVSQASYGTAASCLED